MARERRRQPVHGESIIIVLLHPPPPTPRRPTCAARSLVVRSLRKHVFQSFPKAVCRLSACCERVDPARHHRIDRRKLYLIVRVAMCGPCTTSPHRQCVLPCVLVPSSNYASAPSPLKDESVTTTAEAPAPPANTQPYEAPSWAQTAVSPPPPLRLARVPTIHYRGRVRSVHFATSPSTTHPRTMPRCLVHGNRGSNLRLHGDDPFQSPYALRDTDARHNSCDVCMVAGLHRARMLPNRQRPRLRRIRPSSGR